MDLKKDIKKITADISPVIEGILRDIWNYAEGGYREFRSSERLITVLRDEGFRVTTGIAGIPTAFVAEYGSGSPVIGITAEYDALPGMSQEAACPERKPIPDRDHGHGCGHCALSAGSVGGAIAAKRWLSETGREGTVKLFGTPAEESGFGKVFMAREGVFDGIDAVFTWHPGDVNSVSSFRMNANFKVRFDFRGVPAHAAAAPDKGRSALDACELMNVGVNYLREHVPSTVRMHYAYLDAGGEAPNVVQEKASLLYVIRAPKLATASEVEKRVENVARGAALMTGTEVNIRILGGMSDVIPNPTLSEVLTECFEGSGGPDWDEEDFALARKYVAGLGEEERRQLIENGAKANGMSEEEFSERPLNSYVRGYDPLRRSYVVAASSDVGDLSYIAPVGQFNAAVGIPGTGVHTWQMTSQVGSSIGIKGAVFAARMIAEACARVWCDPSAAEKAKAELTEETGGVYVSPLPEDARPGTIGE